MLGLQWRIPRPPPTRPLHYQPRSWAIDLTEVCRSPEALAFAARRELLAAGLGCWRPPAQLSLLFQNVPGGPHTITIVLLSFSRALGSQTSKGLPAWRVAAGRMQYILYKTASIYIMHAKIDNEASQRADKLIQKHSFKLAQMM